MVFEWKYASPGVRVCECSPRGDYRLVVESLINGGRDFFRGTVYTVAAEWSVGGEDFITQTTSLGAAISAAEEWAAEYETQH